MSRKSFFFSGHKDYFYFICYFNEPNWLSIGKKHIILNRKPDVCDENVKKNDPCTFILNITFSLTYGIYMIYRYNFRTENQQEIYIYSSLLMNIFA